MLGQRADDLVDDDVVRLVARLHDDVGQRVDRLAQRQQVLACLSTSGRSLRRLVRFISTSRSAFSQTEMPLMRIRSRVCWSMTAPPPVASTCGPLSSSRAITRASPARKYGSPCCGENLRNGHAGGAFDLAVGVDKGKAEPGGEPAADRRLAGAHHADQHDGAGCQARARWPFPGHFPPAFEGRR